MASATTSASACIVSMTTRTSGLRLVDSAGSLDAIHLGHRDVHQDHIGRELFGQLDRFETVGRLADHVEALLGHRPAQSLTQHSVVVRQQEPDRHEQKPPCYRPRNLVPAAQLAARRTGGSERERSRQERSDVGASAGQAGERRRPSRPDRGAGEMPSRHRTRVPTPGVLSTSRVAPMLAARSRMPMIP